MHQNHQVEKISLKNQKTVWEINVETIQYTGCQESARSREILFVEWQWNINILSVSFSMVLWNDILWDQSVCLCFDANDIIYSCLFLWYYDTQHTSLIQDNISLDKTFRISELSIDPI